MIDTYQQFLLILGCLGIAYAAVIILLGAFCGFNKLGDDQ
ncbi:hypothetical protein UFOVP83_42 [uncultured Caudovirales phage]|uniref:Uncharacterized protein n=1 Tax=uncultured Caudovirales phage TaxID=2100421 RepID=A0A6J5TCQ2_9CAUD|nr:hypothetical protein UFOVP83_42 [uncultured Caudovirales phage]